MGRVNKNVMFDRVEFVAQLVFADPDPEEEIKRLEAMKQSAKEGAGIAREPMFNIEDPVSSEDPIK